MPEQIAKFLGLPLLVIALVLPFGLSAAAKEQENPFARKVKVQPLPANLTWLSTAGPLELHDLRGKFVLIDFWTYCCINCMHILPELHKLEQAWPKNLVVIGVHSAKFTSEQDTGNIRAAIQRYKIEHAVINDARHELWDAFGVRSWPTVVLIDPEGFAVWGTSGEITFEQVDKVIRGAMPYYRQRKLLDETPLRFDMERQAAAATPLRFPGKIAADEASGRLFISDSNHNRIVVTRLDGTLLEVVGAGAAGRKDGDFQTAEFNQPQGLALRGNELLVADTENHEIRGVDLARREVTTIAGTGQQRREPGGAGRRGDPRHTALSSPWDLLAHGDDLFIAMAGCHQIWKMRLGGASIGAYAGNGREDIADGPLLPPKLFQPGYASFAQPSGLAGDGKWLYVADSEGSSIRAVPLAGRGEVRTVVGTSQQPSARLFTFGDADGPAATARFQHPLGVAYAGGKIYVADSYNHKIRVVNAADGTTQTLAVDGGNSGGLKSTLQADPHPVFFEPAGLAVAAGKLFVADTNHHVIRVVDLKTLRLSTLGIAGLVPPEPPVVAARPPAGGVLKRPAAVVRAEEGAVRLRVELELPDGYKMNPLAPLEYRLDSAADGAADRPGVVDRAGFGKPVRIEKPGAEFDIRLPVKAAAGQDSVRLVVDYYYCREGAEGVCKVGSAAWDVPLEVSARAKTAVVTLRQRAQ